jgi:Methyl-accepting chemotaxis protein (MCP) signalling domain
MSVTEAQSPNPARKPTGWQRLSRQVVLRAMLALVLANALGLVWLGSQTPPMAEVWGLGWGGLAQHEWSLGMAVLCVLMALGAQWRERGLLWQHGLMASSLTALVACQVAVVPQRIDLPLNVCLLLCLLTVYQRWPLIVAACGVFVVQQLALHGSQAPALLLAVWVLQAAYLAWATGQHAVVEGERFEIDFLLRAMGKDGPIRLNMEVLRADSVPGQRLKLVQQRMREAVRQMRQTTGSIEHAADVLSNSGDELTARTHQTASGLRDAALCLEQINVIVQSSAKASSEARAMASQATQMANHGGDLVGQVVSTMREIDQSSRRITDIIGVIDQIAFQTNILALNAAVEAARAGDQGRGFAVVASEVRTLALRSSEAAREIKSLINASVETVSAGSKLVDDAGLTMQDIVAAVRGVGEVFDRLSADSNEHAGSIDVVTQSVKELDAVTQENLQVSERTSQIAIELLGHAASMTEALMAFRLGDDASFLAPAHRAQSPAAPHGAPGRQAAPKVSPSAPRARPEPAAGSAPAAAGIEFF